MSDHEDTTGLVVETDDGSLYVIPATELAKFKVSPSRIEELQSTLDASAEVAGFALGDQVGMGGVLFPKIEPLKSGRAQLGQPAQAFQGCFQYQGSPPLQ